MDFGRRRRRSTLSELVWDPESGICVLPSPAEPPAPSITTSSELIAEENAAHHISVTPLPSSTARTSEAIQSSPETIAAIPSPETVALPSFLSTSFSSSSSDGTTPGLTESGVSSQNVNSGNKELITGNSFDRTSNTDIDKNQSNDFCNTSNTSHCTSNSLNAIAAATSISCNVSSTHKTNLRKDSNNEDHSRSSSTSHTFPATKNCNLDTTCSSASKNKIKTITDYSNIASPTTTTSTRFRSWTGNVYPEQTPIATTITPTTDNTAAVNEPGGTNTFPFQQPYRRHSSATRLPSKYPQPASTQERLQEKQQQATNDFNGVNQNRRSTVVPFLAAFNMFAGSAPENEPKLSRKSSLSDTHHIKVSVKTLVRKMSDCGSSEASVTSAPKDLQPSRSNVKMNGEGPNTGNVGRLGYLNPKEPGSGETIASARKAGLEKGGGGEGVASLISKFLGKSEPPPAKPLQKSVPGQSKIGENVSSLSQECHVPSQKNTQLLSCSSNYPSKESPSDLDPSPDSKHSRKVQSPPLDQASQSPVRRTRLVSESFCRRFCSRDQSVSPNHTQTHLETLAMDQADIDKLLARSSELRRSRREKEIKSTEVNENNSVEEPLSCELRYGNQSDFHRTKIMKKTDIFSPKKIMTMTAFDVARMRSEGGAGQVPPCEFPERSGIAHMKIETSPDNGLLIGENDISQNSERLQHLLEQCRLTNYSSTDVIRTEESPYITAISLATNNGRGENDAKSKDEDNSAGDSETDSIALENDQTRNEPESEILSSSTNIPTLTQEFTHLDRISKYKADRRKQLDYISSKCGLRLSHNTALDSGDREHRMTGYEGNRDNTPMVAHQKEEEKESDQILFVDEEPQMTTEVGVAHPKISERLAENDNLQSVDDTKAMQGTLSQSREDKDRNSEMLLRGSASYVIENKSEGAKSRIDGATKVEPHALQTHSKQHKKDLSQDTLKTQSEGLDRPMIRTVQPTSRILHIDSVGEAIERSRSNKTPGIGQNYISGSVSPSSKGRSGIRVTKQSRIISTEGRSLPETGITDQGGGESLVEPSKGDPLTNSHHRKKSEHMEFQQNGRTKSGPTISSPRALITSPRVRIKPVVAFGRCLPAPKPKDSNATKSSPRMKTGPGLESPGRENGRQRSRFMSAGSSPKLSSRTPQHYELPSPNRHHIARKLSPRVFYPSQAPHTPRGQGTTNAKNVLHGRSPIINTNVSPQPISVLARSNKQAMASKEPNPPANCEANTPSSEKNNVTLDCKQANALPSPRTTPRSKKSSLSLMAVKSEFSAEGLAKPKTLNIRKGIQPVESASYTMKKEESFTSRFRSRSPRPSWGFGGKIEVKRTEKSGEIKIKESSRNSKGKMSEPEIAVKHVKSCKSNSSHESNITALVSKAKSNKVISGYQKAVACDGVRKRASLPLQLTNFRNMKGIDDGNETCEKRSKPSLVSRKRFSLPGENSAPQTTSRAERRENLKREEEETVAKFRRFMYRTKEIAATSSEISERITEEAREIKECCIRVKSKQEAEDVANCFLSAAFRDMCATQNLEPPLLSKNFEQINNRGLLEDPSSHGSLLFSEKNEYSNQKNNRSSNFSKSAPNYDDFSCASSGQSCDFAIANSRPEGDLLDYFPLSPPVKDTDPSQIHPRRRNDLSRSPQGRDTNRSGSPHWKVKHYKKPTVSAGNTNLHGPSTDNITSEIASTESVIPNVRKIDFQTMICIPFPHSDDAVTKGQHVVQHIDQRPIVPLQIMPETDDHLEGSQNEKKRVMFSQTADSKLPVFKSCTENVNNEAVHSDIRSIAPFKEVMRATNEKNSKSFKLKEVASNLNESLDLKDEGVDPRISFREKAFLKEVRAISLDDTKHYECGDMKSEGGRNKQKVGQRGCSLNTAECTQTMDWKHIMQGGNCLALTSTSEMEDSVMSPTLVSYPIEKSSEQVHIVPPLLESGLTNVPGDGAQDNCSNPEYFQVIHSHISKYLRDGHSHTSSCVDLMDKREGAVDNKVHQRPSSALPTVGDPNEFNLHHGVTQDSHSSRDRQNLHTPVSGIAVEHKSEMTQCETASNLGGEIEEESHNLRRMNTLQNETVSESSIRAKDGSSLVHQHFPNISVSETEGQSFIRKNNSSPDDENIRNDQLHLVNELGKDNTRTFLDDKQMGLGKDEEHLQTWSGNESDCQCDIFTSNVKQPQITKSSNYEPTKDIRAAFDFGKLKEHQILGAQHQKQETKGLTTKIRENTTYHETEPTMSGRPASDLININVDLETKTSEDVNRKANSIAERVNEYLSTVKHCNKIHSNVLDGFKSEEKEDKLLPSFDSNKEVFHLRNLNEKAKIVETNMTPLKSQEVESHANYLRINRDTLARFNTSSTSRENSIYDLNSSEDSCHSGDSTTLSRESESQILREGNTSIGFGVSNSSKVNEKIKAEQKTQNHDLHLASEVGNTGPSKTSVVYEKLFNIENNDVKDQHISGAFCQAGETRTEKTLPLNSTLDEKNVATEISKTKNARRGPDTMEAAYVTHAGGHGTSTLNDGFNLVQKQIQCLEKGQLSNEKLLQRRGSYSVLQTDAQTHDLHAEVNKDDHRKHSEHDGSVTEGVLQNRGLESGDLTVVSPRETTALYSRKSVRLSSPLNDKERQKLSALEEPQRKKSPARTSNLLSSKETIAQDVQGSPSSQCKDSTNHPKSPSWRHNQIPWTSSALDGIYSSLDLSDDSFNSLFLQNAIYLEDVSREDQESEFQSRCPSSSVKRKPLGKLGVQARVKKKNSLDTRESKDENREDSPSPLQPKNKDGCQAVDPSVNSNENGFTDSIENRNVAEPVPSVDSHSQHIFSTTSVSSAPVASLFDSATLCLSDVSNLKGSFGDDFDHPGTYTRGTELPAGEKGTYSHHTSQRDNLTLPLKKQFDYQLAQDSVTEKEDGCSSLNSSRSGLTDEEAATASEGETQVEMEARRRRRLLERVSDVSSEDSTSWRSKVYQKDTTNNAVETSYHGEKRNSYHSRETLGTSGIRNNEEEAPEEPRRRRRSEDSNALAERLAMRRAKRLEEQGDSSSQDGSFDSPRQRERGWSRDGSAKSVDSAENGDVDDRLHSRRSRRGEGDSLLTFDSESLRNSSSRRNSRDSILSVDSNDNLDDGEKVTRFRSRRRDSEDSNAGESQEAGSSQGLRSRKWSSKDSCFRSADSASSLDHTEVERHRRGSLENGTEEQVTHTRRRRRQLHEVSSNDSAFSESKEKADDATNSNSKNSSKTTTPSDGIVSSFAARRRRMEDFIDEGDELNESSSVISETKSGVLEDKTEIPQSTVNGSQNVSSPDPQSRATTNGVDESPSSPRWRSHVPLTASASPEATSVSKDSNKTETTSLSEKDGDAPIVGSFQARLMRMRGSISEEVTPLSLEASPQIKAAVDDPTTSKNGKTGTEPKLNGVKPAKDSNDQDKFVTPPSSPKSDTKTRRRKVRKDKNSVRKSPTSMADSDTDEEVGENAQPGSDTNPEEGKTSRRRGEGSFVSQHASFWENTAPNTQHAPPPRQRTNIPTRYMGDLSAKIIATRQKFNQNASTEASVTSSSKPKTDGNDEVISKKIHRGRTDFSSLLQKFSGSESNSEKSDTDATGGGSAGVSGIPRKRSFVRRQEAKDVVTSSEESDSTRRTPERTQSLKVTSRLNEGRVASSPLIDNDRSSASKTRDGLEKSSSFRSDFMSRRATTQKSSESSNSSSKQESSANSVISSKAAADTSRKTNGGTARGDVVKEKPAASLEKSLELLNRVTDELEHPEKPSSIEVKSPSHRANRDSWSSIHECEDVLKKVDASITSMANRRSPDKAQSPGKGASKFTFDQHNKASSTDKTSATETALQSKDEQKHFEQEAKPTYKSEKAKLSETSSQSSKLAGSKTSSERNVQSAKSPRSSSSSLSSLETTTVTSATPSSSTPSLSKDVTSTIATTASSTVSSDSTGMRRTSSFKETTTTTRSDSFERKGILKRTTSLTKTDVSEISVGSSSFPVVDPQLKKILQQRKQLVGDVDEKEEEDDDDLKDLPPDLMRRRSRALSAAEEIEETLKYSQLRAAEKGKNPDEDEGLKRMSVAERIYSMQTKIEESKSQAVTPKSKSGISTPRSRPRSGFITPTSQRSLDEGLLQPHSPAISPATSPTGSQPTTARTAATTNATAPGKVSPTQQQQQNESTSVSGTQLMERLTQIWHAGEAYEEKRHKFQNRSRNNWRHQTQPVTLEEIQAADSLEAVSSFRALVRKKTSINAFDQLKAQTVTVARQQPTIAGKKAEFPQHLAPPPKHQRRNRRLRHRTLPVTAEELNAVPENQELATDSEWAKHEDAVRQDSRADSGILSGSDSLFDQSSNQSENLRNLTLDCDLSDNDPSRMSVTAKASYFRVMEEKTKAERDKEKSASGAKRYILRKKRERSQTMPITEEEVKTAANLGDNSTANNSSGKPVVVNRQPEVVNRSKSLDIPDEEGKEQEDDELTKLSLTEKVKLFSQPKEKQPAKTEAPVVRRRNRKHASRFNTQFSESLDESHSNDSPVTSEEVEKAAGLSRISPLAMSMVKPPDPDILKGLPLKDQRQLMAQHAEMFLSQSSLKSQQSRSGSTTSLSQPSSRRASVTMEEADAKKSEGILKDKSASTKDLNDVKSILKTEPTKAKSEPEVHSILKPALDGSKQPSETVSAISSSEPRGILKKTKSDDIAAGDSGEDIRGILKHTDSEEEEPLGSHRSRSNSQPLGILKRDISPQHGDSGAEPKSILKAPSQENVHEVIKSAIRRGSHDSDSSTSSSGVLKSAMRNRSKNNSECEEGQGDSASTSDLKSALHKVAAEDSEDPNSHKHVDLSLSVRSEERSEVTTLSSSTTRGVTSKMSSTTREAVSRSVTSTGGVVSSSETSVASHSTSSKTNLSVPDDPAAKSGQSASEGEGEGESSAGELLEDTPRSTRLKRKSRFSNRSSKSERYKTQPPELPTESSTSTTDPGTRRKYKYEGRNKTQPITPDEMREAEATTPSTNLTRTPGGSIADRLNQLKTSGEEEWKKRVGRKEDLTAPMPEAVVKLREKSGMPVQRPNSIADRLNELETSKMTWKGRVEESDAKQFTVAGKLTNTTESPLVTKLKNLPKKDDAGSKGNSPLSSPVTPTKEFIAKIPLPKDIVQDHTVKVESLTTKTVVAEEEKKEPVKVEVPDMGEEMETFFAVKSIEEIEDRVALEVDDFDNIFIEAEMILSTVRKPKPQRKTRASTHNPLKTMSQKVEIRQEYTEVSYGTAEKEFKRVKREGLAKDAGFAQAALAGLASKENFKQVELRRSDSGSTPHGQKLDPFNELMLLHVKGRRTVQIRLVEPNTRSLNAGDCFILVTPDKIIQWEGQFANVIEKAKTSEIASFILQKRDLGCKKAPEVLTVTQSKDHLGAGKLLWAALEGEKQCQECGPDAEDELYESSIVKSNMVYKLEGNALLPYEEYWGCMPRHEMLKRNEVIVFDFGTEFYIWQGKSVAMEQRKLGLKLAKQLYEKGYDYSESVINPFSPLRSEEDGGVPVKSSTRPKWTIFGKVNQNMETILFREKFADWPDSSRIIGCKGHEAAESNNQKELQELKPFDSKLMVRLNTSPVTLKLEGAHVGRGVEWAEDMQGFIKKQDIITLEVTVWHVMEYEHFKMPDQSYGHFHDGDTYVVRWQYMIANSNLKSLKGSAARNSLTGRERCAYFFWQGNHSTINEKGASALMTVELDEERGPQVRVLEGKEPPCFLNLFGGKMVVHIGKREEPSTNTEGAWRLYCVRGDYENELCLLEIPVCIDHLRSRSSLVLLNVKTGLVYIWHGVKSPTHVREHCRKAMDRLKENTPLEMGLHEKANITVTEVEEGEEKREIWAALDSKDRTIYHSLLTDPKPYKHTMRLFHMSSVNLIFEVHEQLNPSRVPDLTTPFPFLQADLYKSTQPALFLIDNHHEVYLWQGWWPIGSHDTENVHTGSATARFNMDRRCAMETTLNYCKEKNASDPPPAYLVCAGLEPVSFTSLFPYWSVDTVVRDMAVEEGKSIGYKEKVSDVLTRLTQTRYTLAELQERPLPEGVDPLRLEAYMHDDEFEEILEMSREEFYAQPVWKQKSMKQQVSLY